MSNYASFGVINISTGLDYGRLGSEAYMFRYSSGPVKIYFLEVHHVFHPLF